MHKTMVEFREIDAEASICQLTLLKPQPHVSLAPYESMTEAECLKQCVEPRRETGADVEMRTGGLVARGSCYSLSRDG